MKRWQVVNPIQFSSAKGNLKLLECAVSLPFEPKRIFWVSDVPAGEARGFHAHLTGEQVLFCLSGEIRAKFDDGFKSEEIVLTPKGSGVWMKNLVWGEQTFLEPSSILLVLASNLFVEEDYLRDRNLFEALIKKGP